MKFQADIALLPKMIEFVRAEIEGANLDRFCQNKIELSVEEALVNIILHGESKHIEMDIKIGERVEIFIKDFGPPFNPLEAGKPDLNASLEERKIGGLGIHLMTQSMDEVQYVREKNHNLLILIKKINRPSQKK